MQAETIKVNDLYRTFFKGKYPIYNIGYTVEELMKKNKIKISKNDDIKELQKNKNQIRICQFGKDCRLKNIPFISFKSAKKELKIYLITDDEDKLDAFSTSQKKRLAHAKATVEMTRKMITTMEQLKLFKK